MDNDRVKVFPQGVAVRLNPGSLFVIHRAASAVLEFIMRCTDEGLESPLDVNELAELHEAVEDVGEFLDAMSQAEDLMQLAQTKGKEC